MTQRELKQKLYDLISGYFGAATIVWGKTKFVNPQTPQVVLTSGSVIRPYQPITKFVNGVSVQSYPSKTTLQVDLYTKGSPLNGDDGITAAMENTAVNDLTDFLNYINSVYVDHWSTINDISVMANEVRDLSELINDMSWEYRAMVELEIGFTQTATGFTGTMHENGALYDENGKPVADSTDFNPTPSGGRTPELADQFTGWFEQVEGPEYIKED